MVQYFPFINGSDLGGSAFNYIVAGFAGSFQQQALNVGAGAAGSTSNNFSGSSIKFCLVRNVGPDTVYIKTHTGVPDTEDYPLEQYETVSLECSPNGMTALYAICDTSETGSLKVLATS